MNAGTISTLTDEQIADYTALASRIIAAPQLTSSPKLRELFLYIVECSLRGEPSAATEQQIGIHVFQRQPGYNSGDDSIVRSQMRLLRMKLASYFANEGAREPVVIVIPKGHYVPMFVPADSGMPAVTESESLTAPGQTAASDSRADGATTSATVTERSTPSVWIVIAAVVLGMVGGYGLRAWMNPTHKVASDIFWSPFLRSNETLVIYSNPVFTGDLIKGFHIQGEHPGPAHEGTLVDDTYTGTGEASAVMMITHLFDDHDARFILKRSRLVTWDEAQLHNLIFVGASSQNGALGDLKTLTQFQIALDANQHGFIRNLHPAQGEPADFPVISTESETAIVALVPGLSPGTSIAIFSGLSTLGTQAAVEFMTHPENTKEIASKVGSLNGTTLPFEAVLGVTVRKGVPIGATLLTVHAHSKG